MSGSGGLISFISRARKSFISSIWTPPSGTAQINGDVVVTGETSLDGGLGADLDAKGQYLLNDQTTTNMMSKGPAYRFDGVDDVVTVGNVSDWDGFSSFSVHAKYKPSALGGSYGIANKYGTSGQRSWDIYITDTNEIILGVSSDGTNVEERITTTAPINTVGVEYDIVVTFDAGTFAVYVNGISQAVDDNFALTSLKAGSSLAYIGTRLGGGTDFLEGELNHLQIFNTALTASEVKDLSANTPFKWIGASQTELVTNGDFAADTDWTKTGTGATIDAGVLTLDNATGTISDVFAYQSITTVIGKEYSLTFDISSITLGGSQSLLVGDNSGASFNETYTTAGTKTINYRALTTTSQIIFRRNSAGSGAAYNLVVDIDNASLKTIGVVADYPSHGISETHWTDASGINNDGAVTGCEVLNQTDGQAFKNIILSPVGQDATPKEGQLIYNSATNKLNVWTGAAWEVVTSA